MKIKAVIMAGGEGTRLRPLTCGLPKPMVSILNRPIMEYIIKLLKENQIEDIAVTLAYLPEVIQDYFGDGSKWGVNLTYFVEDTPLGTGGSVKNTQDFLDETFIVISGDALTDIHLNSAIAFHRKKQSQATLVLKKESIPLEYGVIVTDQEDRIIRFLEKPSWGEVFSDTINTGIYILEPEVMDYYKKGEKFDFSKDLFPKILRDKLPMYGYVTSEYWRDIGDIRTYTSSQFDVLQKKVKIPTLQEQYREIQKDVWIGENVHYSKKVQFIPPVCIERNTYIKDGAIIGPYAVIGENCKIGEGTSIKNSILWAQSTLGNRVQLRGSTLCDGVAIGDRVNLYEQSVVGSGARIYSGVTIRPNVKIWPQKKIEENTIVNQNLVWGRKISKTLFGHRDISGKLNIDITPEFASQLGSAIASTLGERGKMVVQSDLNNGGQLIKQSIASGIIAGGGRVIDIGIGPLPILRYAVPYFACQGGVYISGDDKDPNTIHVEILNSRGANIHRTIERKIENIFNRGDFQRVNHEQMSRVLHQNDFSRAYITQGLSLLKNREEIKKKNMRVIIASSSESILFLATTFLETIGCKVLKIKAPTKEQSIQKYSSYITQQIKKGAGDLGFFINEKGENIILFDEKGQQIQQESYQLLANLIILKSGVSKKLVASHVFPEILEDMAEKYGAKVIRTKSAPSEVMNEILKREEVDEKQLLPYVLHYDAIWSMGIIIDYLIGEKISLKNLVNEIPAYYYKKDYIPCSWKDKGRVIREIISQYEEEDVELFEGVKIRSDKGWTIILPDSEKPLVNIYTQGLSEEYAQELSADFTEKVKGLIQNS